jgi:hypothetical protein
MIINASNVTEPSTPTSGRTFVYVDQADNHLKTKDDTGTVLDITDTSLVTSNDSENLQQIDTKGITPHGLFNHPLISSFIIKNAVSGLTQTVAPGGSYNLLSDMLTSQETVTGNLGKLPTFYTKDPVFNANANDGSTFTAWLDETNNKIVFPSNKNTYGDGTKVNYVPYYFRAVLIFDITDTNGTTTNFSVKAKRVVDNTVVYSWKFIISDSPALTDVVISLNAPTFVGSSTLAGSEADPYVVDGMYFDFENRSDSSDSPTVKSFDLRIFKGFV